MNPLTNSYMSAKSVLQTLEDAQLIRLFLDFVANYRLNYHKQRKEISYKCFEATWMLPIAKATGYGRTETEAYKNALKNLLELLMEDTNYVEYFATVLAPSSSHPKMQLKTEGHEPEEKTYESYSNKAQNRARQETQHSKINLNRSMSQKGDPEVEETRNKLKALEAKLGSVLEENKVLRERLMNVEEKKRVPTEKCLNSQGSQNSLAGKVPVPRLNLSVLPNYHKKSEKCLNEVLMAAYQEKHGAQKLY